MQATVHSRGWKVGLQTRRSLENHERRSCSRGSQEVAKAERETGGLFHERLVCGEIRLLESHFEFHSCRPTDLALPCAVEADRQRQATHAHRQSTPGTPGRVGSAAAPRQAAP